MSNHAEPFRKMADRIELNSVDDFCGSVVIVPPDGDAVALLLLDGNKDPAMFWALVKTKADMALSDIDAKQRQGQWGR